MRVLNLVTSPGAEFFQVQVRALADRGVDQTTIGVPGEREPGDDAMTSRSLLDYVQFSLPALRRSFEDYDLIHANYGLTAPPAIAQPNLPVVVSLWGSDLLGEYARISRFCARRADAVIVMSPEMAEALDVECHVIPHGVDLQRFRPFPRAPARAAVGWPQDARHVLFPYPAENAVKDYPRAERVVQTVDERLDDEVVLQTLHGVPHARMPLYVNAADALLLTSKREGSPNSVKEAMACNLPVVATDVGDVRARLDGVEPSHVRDSDAGLVEALLDVLERDSPSNGRRAVEPLGVEAMARRIRDVYESVVEEERESAGGGTSPSTARPPG